MLLGACWPYLDQRRAPAETWAVAEALGLASVRVSSNASVEDVAELRRRWPGLRWVVRAKLPKVDGRGERYGVGDERPDLLDYREWPSEPSPRECLERLLGWGCAVDLELANEPDIEWDEEASWGPTERWEVCSRDFRRWGERQLEALGAAFAGELRLLAPALSEGWPERHAVWLAELGGLFVKCDALAVHAYTNGLDFGDLDWGGRPVAYARLFPEKPILVTEVNDNGRGGVDGALRGGEVGAYLAWLAKSCPVVELVCLFALPGQPGAPSWWGWDLAMVEGLRGALGRAVEVEMPEFVLGVKALADELGAAVVGEPLEDERYLNAERSEQFTTTGKFEYSKPANRAHFFLAARTG